MRKFLSMCGTTWVSKTTCSTVNFTIAKYRSSISMQKFSIHIEMCYKCKMHAEFEDLTGRKNVKYSLLIFILITHVERIF